MEAARLVRAGAMQEEEEEEEVVVFVVAIMKAAWLEAGTLYSLLQGAQKF